MLKIVGHNIKIVMTQPRLLEALLMAQLGKVYSKIVCIDYPQLDEE